MLILGILATFALAASVLGDCDAPETVNITQFPYSFPYDTSIPQPYRFVSGCALWNFKIPKQKYATVIVNSQFGSHDYFEIRNSVGFGQNFNGYVPASIPQNGSIVYYFPADEESFIFLVQRSDAGGLLSFRIDIHSVPDGPYTLENVTVNTANIIPLSKLIGNELRLKNIDKSPQLALSLVSTDSYDHRTDNCFIYEGPSCKEGTFIQSIGYLTLTNTLHSKDVALCCFSPIQPDFHLIYAAKPDSMTKVDRWISRFSSDRSISMDAINGTKTVNAGMYLTTYCPGGCKEYLESAQTFITPLGPDYSYIYENITKISLWAGFPSMSRWHKLTEMSSNLTYPYLPQELPGIYRTYEVYACAVDISISTNSSKWNRVNSPRKGFFMTSNYPFIELSQNTTSFIESTPNTNFSINGCSAVMDMGFGGVVLVNTDDSSDSSNSATLPLNGTKVLKGSKLTFIAQQGQGNGKGSIVYFDIQPGAFSSSVSLSTISAIITFLLHFLL